MKSEKAFNLLTEDVQAVEMVDFTTFNAKYNLRDQASRKAMKELINSDKNKVVDVFSTLL